MAGLKCSSCAVHQPRDAFSRKQLDKGASARRCKACVAASVGGRDVVQDENCDVQSAARVKEETAASTEPQTEFESLCVALLAFGDRWHEVAATEMTSLLMQMMRLDARDDDERRLGLSAVVSALCVHFAKQDHDREKREAAGQRSKVKRALAQRKERAEAALSMNQTQLVLVSGVGNLYRILTWRTPDTQLKPDEVDQGLSGYAVEECNLLELTSSHLLAGAGARKGGAPTSPIALVVSMLMSLLNPRVDDARQSRVTRAVRCGMIESLATACATCDYGDHDTVSYCFRVLVLLIAGCADPEEAKIRAINAGIIDVLQASMEHDRRYTAFWKARWEAHTAARPIAALGVPEKLEEMWGRAWVLYVVVWSCDEWREKYPDCVPDLSLDWPFPGYQYAARTSSSVAPPPLHALAHYAY